MPLEMLDNIQKAAVTCSDQNILCDSKAGSGKTRILMNRCVYLMEHGVKPEEIMLVTFTNKAAKEMMSRIQALSPDGDKILCGTFHYIAMYYIRQYAEELGFTKDFTILSPDDCAKKMKAVLQTVNLLHPDLEVLDNEALKYKSLVHAYSASRNLDINFRDYLLEKCNFKYKDADAAELVIKYYTNAKKASNTMDFDDLLENFKELLITPKTNKLIAGRFKHILVDEYQDINNVQNSIIYHLRGFDRNLFVVGDPYQCIYGFRGSKIEYIRDFEENYDASVFYVQNNYRSTQPILDAACAATDGKAVLRSQTPGSLRPAIKYTRDNIEQADYAVRQVKNLIDKGESPDQIAILVRSTVDVQLLEQNLNKLRIPYVTRAGFAYFEKSHIKDILMFLSLYCNPKNQDALKRYFGLFDGLGEKTIQKCISYMQDNSLTIEKFAEEVANGTFKVSKRAKDGVANMFEVFRNVGIQTRIANKINLFVSSFYSDYMKKTFPEDCDERMADVANLQSLASSYKDIQTFVNESIVDTSVDDDGGKNKGPKVVISTIHRAKGLEWDNVIICNLGPRFKTISYQEEEEETFEIPEDVRLFYVAITRARKRLLVMANYSEAGRKNSRLILSHLVPRLENCCRTIR